MNKLFLLAFILAVPQAFSAEGTALQGPSTSSPATQASPIEEVGTENVNPPTMEFNSMGSNQETYLTKENWANSSATTTISQTAYYVGAAFETAGFVVPLLVHMTGFQKLPLFSGWGIGHAIQGRYSDRGWIFTVSTGALYTGLIASVFIFSAEAISGLTARTDEVDRARQTISSFGKLGAVAVIAGVGILGVSIWNIVDVWNLPSHYKVVKEKPFSVKPLFAFYNKEEMDIGLSLKYKF